MHARDITVQLVAPRRPNCGGVTALERKWEANWIPLPKCVGIMWCQPNPAEKFNGP